MVTNPMNKYEWRLARETRRLAQIELKKMELGNCSDDDDVQIARIVTRRIQLGLVWIVLAIVPVCSINGTIKNYHDNQQVTLCEQAAATNHVEADCSKEQIKVPK